MGLAKADDLAARLMRTIVAAALADGHVTPDERTFIDNAMVRINPGAEAHRGAGPQAGGGGPDLCGIGGADRAGRAMRPGASCHAGGAVGHRPGLVAHLEGTVAALAEAELSFGGTCA